MTEVGRVIKRRMTPGLPNKAKHIKDLLWITQQSGHEWSTRAVMVDKVSRSAKGTFLHMKMAE